ncbi:alkaline phosphatase D family protein [Pareuzebyella sediminis]|uniref:alkaline phosphatase D family protein n=1 Tax=Pareuzebyella sediminis TaxID=2607998 RepID=UPI0011EDA9CB|nr:alkaline phosphatase D family protein [Pareuzebyella sediminis]
MVYVRKRVQFTLSTLLFAFLQWGMLYSQGHEKVYFTTGLKIGEVTDTSAVILTRLCAVEEPNPIVHRQKEPPFREPINFDDTMPVVQMDGGVPGAFGEVKMELISNSDTISRGWTYVSSYKDYTIKNVFHGLRPYTKYKLVLSGRKNENAPVTKIRGEFRTAPKAQEIVPVFFTSSTCQYFWDYDDPLRGFKVYDQMRNLNPDFHCQTGDYVYYDKPGPMATTVSLARHKWHAINAWSSLVDFYAHTPLFIQKDDHDVTKDDATPFSTPFGEITFDDGIAIWKEQTPTYENRPYRTLRYGQDLEIWFVEGRLYRNTDNSGEPQGSIWGDEQKKWFVKSVADSDATFKILMSPTPVVGPDRDAKRDNHANSTYEEEGRWLRNFIAAQKNMYIVNGDRHWQYVSKDSSTGVLEFSQGPSSDAHAQGWKVGDVRPEHEFLRVMGGFLAVKVERVHAIAQIAFIHYDVNGNQVHRKVILSK